MPGILRMNDQHTNGDFSLKRGSKVDDAEVGNHDYFPHEKPNGALPALWQRAANNIDDGGPVVGVMPAKDDFIASTANPDVDSESEPSIEHITHGFQPLSKLVMRVTQVCYNGFLELLDQLSECTPGVVDRNGFGPPHNLYVPGQDDSLKRLKLMEFANHHRERFIKILVLSQWSKQVAEVGKMIDLWNWYRTQLELYDAAAEWIGRIRLSTSQAKLPSPDIRTALDVLSTGKAPWISDVSSD